jgi:RHS repeat-associated protein
VDWPLRLSLTLRTAHTTSAHAIRMTVRTGAALLLPRAQRAAAVTVSLLPGPACGPAPGELPLLSHLPMAHGAAGVSSARTAPPAAPAPLVFPAIPAHLAAAVRSSTVPAATRVTPARLLSPAGTQPLTVTLQLQAGWNLITLPLSPTTTLDAHTLLASLIATTHGKYAELDAYTNGQFSPSLYDDPGDNLGIGGANFTLQLGQGYALYTDTAAGIPISGTSAANPPQPLAAGWNLVGLPAAIVSQTHAYTLLTTLLAQTGGIYAELDGYSNGRFAPSAYDDPGDHLGLDGTDFTLQPGQGYALYTDRPGQLGPAGSTPAAPTAVTGAPADRQVTVFWAIPASDGGSPITDYKIYVSDGSVVDVGSNATSAVVGGLTDGVAYTFSVTAVNAAGEGPRSPASAPVTPFALPPDPSTVAPPTDTTVATNAYSSTQFLYTGSNPIQTGVVSGTIAFTTTAVLRGRVLDLNGDPLAGATITVLDHPEFGQTTSRADGRFDLAVNGGGQLTLNYAMPGYLPVQRQVQAPWQDYGYLPDVNLTPYDPHVSTVSTGAASTTMQVAQGSMEQDADGTRQATLLFPPGTTAVMTMTNGLTETLTGSLQVRATELTVGSTGPGAMPGPLPATSAYTYAADFSVDAATAAGAASVGFSQPIPVYVQNFLGFPVGSPVPVGYYDQQQGNWVAAPNGRVVGILGSTVVNGTTEASIDVDGAGKAATAAELVALGISDAELTRLATLYAPGQSLWRVTITHFTPWDCNWPYGPPPDATAPPPVPSPPPPDIDNHKCGCIIGVQQQSLGESVPVAGTPFNLHYESDRQPGYTTRDRLVIPVTGATVPADLDHVEVEVDVAGQSITQTFPMTTTNQTYTFVWNGLNAYGQPVRGTVVATVRTSYIYNPVYQTPDQTAESFAQFGAGISVRYSRVCGWVYMPPAHMYECSTRKQIAVTTVSQVPLGLVQTASGLGGWDLDIHNTYDSAGHTLYLGDGTKRIEDALLSNSIDTVAGGSNYNGPASEASLDYPQYVAIGPDGALYVSASIPCTCSASGQDNDYVYEIGSDGTIRTVAGNGVPGYSGDGGPATAASLNDPRGLAVGPDGSLYIADSGNNVIRKVSPTGIISTVAGGGSPAAGLGDGGPATAASLSQPDGAAVGPGGSLYIADTLNDRVRKVAPDGIISTVAGNGTSVDSGDGGPATAASVYLPSGVAVGPDGSLYLTDPYYNRIREVTPDGIIHAFAGNGTGGYSGDGRPAIKAELSFPFGLAIGPDGSLYIADTDNHVIRKVTPDGTISTVAGGGPCCFGDGGPATAAFLNEPNGVAVGPDNSLYIADSYDNRIREVTPDGIINTIAGNGTGSYGGDGGPATAASLSEPGAVAVGPDGSLYIADTLNDRIRKVTPDGTISTVAGDGTCKCLGDGGPAIAASLSRPGGIAVGPDGSLYISDTQDNRVREVTSDGAINTIAGTGTQGYSGDGAPATAANLNNPEGVAVGTDGSIYIADSGNSVIRKVAPDGTISTVAGNGVSSYGGNGLLATKAELNHPEDVTEGPDGSLYISDTSNAVIRKVTPSGIISTVAGGGAPPSGLGDGGPATAASLDVPSGVAVGADGTLYIADTNNAVIRKVVPDGTISTVAGSNGTQGPSGYGGPTTAAGLVSPTGVAVDPDGNIYITDSGANRILKVAPPLPGVSTGDAVLPSSDGSEVYIFDASGRQLLTLDGLTSAVLYSFGYDSAGRLTTVTDRSGNITTIQRDGNGNPTAIIAPNGQQTIITTASNGYLNSITDPAGRVIHMTSDANGMLQSFTDANGNTGGYRYDSLGRLILDQEPGPNGGSTMLSRVDGTDAFTITTTTALGRRTAYVTANLPDGTQQQTVIDPAGGQTVTVYNPNGTVTTTYPDGSVVTRTNGPDPRWGMLAPIPAQVQTQFPSGLTETVTTIRTAALAAQGSFILKNQNTGVTVNGNTYTQTYDAGTRTLTTTSPLGRRSTTLLDALGRPVQQTSPGVLPVQFSYDSKGRLSTIVQGTRAYTLTYDLNWNVASITDPLGHATSYANNAVGEPTTTTRADGNQIQAAYDNNGNLTSITPRGKTAHTFAYTSRNLLQTYTPPALATGGTPTGYQYNADQQIAEVDQPDGTKINVAYDSAGRVSGITIPQGASTYAYDPTTEHLTTSTAPDEESSSYTYDGALLTDVSTTGPIPGTIDIDYSYDTQLRLSSETVDGNTVNFGYDSDSDLTQAGAEALTYDPTSGQYTGSILGTSSDSLGYDPYGEVSTYQAMSGSTKLLADQYARDARGRITQKTETVGGATHVYTYGYDKVGRLTSVQEDGATSAQYTYDANGNRLSATSPSGTVMGNYDAQDRLTTYGATTYTYTANGNLASKTDSSTNQATSYTYDNLGNLTQVTQPDGTQITYLVDGQNRRIGKEVNGTLVQGFLYDDYNLTPIAETDGSGNIVSQFVYTSRLGAPAYMIENGVTYRIITDQLGSPRLVVNASTGRVVQEMDYDTWGNVITDTSPGFQPFGFAGGLYDRDTGLVRFGARDYDPSIGRWTSKDPSGLADGPNIYKYAYGDPVDFEDPSGLWGVGPIASGSAEGGVGPVVSAGGTASGGAGVFWGGPQGVNGGEFGSAGEFLGENQSYPGGGETPWALGAYGGAGGGLFCTNANSAQELNGPFKTISVNIGLIISGSLQVSWSGSTWIISFTAGPGAGVSISNYTTNTWTH